MVSVLRCHLCARVDPDRRYGCDDLHLPSRRSARCHAAGERRWTARYDTLTYSYDELGRGTGLAVNGVSRSRTLDALGRVTGETNVLGALTYAYVGATERVQTVNYPNGQATTSVLGRYAFDP